MKLVLCSEGFHTSNTVEACVKLVGKPKKDISVAIINEAYAVEAGNKRWVLDNLNDVANNFPGNLDMVSLLALTPAQIVERIASKDVIFVVGGNSDYQLQVFRKSGFAALLPELLKTKVYVGSSAGSMVLGRRVSSEAYEAVFGEREDFGVEDFLGLVDFAIMPHFGSDSTNNTAAVLDKFAAGKPFAVYGLRDDSAVVIDGNVKTFIGSDPYVVT